MVSTRSGRIKKETRTPPQETPSSSGSIHQDYPFSPPLSSRLGRSESTEIPFRNSVLPSYWRSRSEKTPSCSSRLMAAKRVLNKPRKVDIEVKKLLSLCSPGHVDIIIPTAPPACQRPQEDQPTALETACTTSLNITEFVKRQQYDSDEDSDEIQSTLDPAFECVNGHKVRKENAPLIRAIFDKYGDITVESEGKPATIVSIFLERVCAIYERLKATKFSEVTQKNLTEMLEEVAYLEAQKLNLGWLHEKLDYIHKTKMSSKDYLNFKKDGTDSDIIITKLEDKVAELKRELSLREQILVAEKGKADQIKKTVLDIKTRVDYLRTHSLVDGLL